MGGSFCFDPWVLYRRGVLTNPNLIVMGQVGRGKSTFVKTFVWRQMAFGRQSWVIDPKGEYGPLAHACATTPLRLSPGGPQRLNPLDMPAAKADSDAAAMERPRADLVASLVSSSLARRLLPAERAAVDLAVIGASRRSEPPTLGAVVEAMLEPDADLAASVNTDAAGLAADGRAPALELRRLVGGDLAGMFDGRTATCAVDLDAPLVTLDLSRVFSSPALPLLMTCAISWMQSALARADGVKRLVVIDEAWAVLHDLSTARWLQSVFKLSRAFGVSNVAVVHRLSDLRSAGAEGSSQQQLAEGLLSDSETRVVFGQPISEAGVTAEMVGLTGVERDVVAHLPRGVALWKVGDRSFLVEHLVGGMETEIVDTDSAMLDSAPEAEQVAR
ncbi:MAG TPA: hypothetical protein VMU75_03755 [Acidimicrobiales bacterium]|nr:hypothetical protein [Acidimicrobiales bacterium]